MIDGKQIFNEAAEIAFPRYPGSEGDARAIAWLEKRLGAIGLETSLQWFSYDLRPAQRALRMVLVVSALIVACAGFVISTSPLAGVGLLAAAVIPGLIFLSWSPWLEKLYRHEGPTRTANVAGRRGVVSPRLTLILMAHHDSKSQSLSFPFRMALTVVAITGVLALTSLAVVAFLSGSAPGPSWLAPIAGGVSAVAAFALSNMTSGNRSPGGVDNAGSVAIVLAAARQLIEELAADIELVVLSTGAEEDHMLGAMRWLDAHVQSVVDPVFCLNFDGAGAPGRAVLIERFGFGQLFSAEMSAAARRAAARLGINPRGIVMLPGIGIDAIPFAHRGVPCLTLSSGSLGKATMAVHSADDHAEHLDPDTLAEISNLAVETLKDLAGQKTDAPHPTAQRQY